MSQAAPGTVLAVEGLRTALEEMADALAQANLDRVLACEARIESALAAVPTRQITVGHDVTLRREIDAARLALTRCRRLGLSLDGVIATSLSVRGVAPGYGPANAFRDDLHSLNLTV
jgi:hypothetical protein